MNRDSEESSVLLHVRLRRTFDRIRERVLVENAQRAAAFGDQQSPVRKKCETERRVHVTSQHLQFERLLLRRDDLAVRICDVGWLRLESRGRRSDVSDQLKDLLIRELLRRETDHAL